jgi:hypothetical protein
MARPRKYSEDSLGAQDTECTWRPTWIVAHTPARQVIVARAGAMSGRSSVQVPTSQSGSPQRQRRLDHTSVTGHPKAGRSASSTRVRSLTLALLPQALQPISRSVDSTVTTRRSGWRTTFSTSAPLVAQTITTDTRGRADATFEASLAVQDF